MTVCVVRSAGTTRECDYDVTIVGAGFAGAMVAVHLARVAPELRVRLCGARGEHGRGVAYGTTCRRHLLNVPAAKMSAFPENPEHFWRWINARSREVVAKEAFVSRQEYGAYVGELLREAKATARGLEVTSMRVVDVQPNDETFIVATDQNEQFTTSGLVLALGNFPPGELRGVDADVRRSERYISSPWDADALARVGERDDVLIVGSGLTAVDVLLSLEQRDAGGTIHVLSRRGLLPIAHRASVPANDVFRGRNLPASIRAMTRLVRREAAAAEKNGGDWRAVIDALRPHTQRYWNSLSSGERRRFLRHVRPFWEAHRHRIAPEVISVVERLRARGQLILHKARIERISAAADHLVVSVFDRTTRKPQTFTAHFVINCTGPETNYRRLEDPLVSNLLRRGVVVPDALSLGIETTPDGRVTNSAGIAAPNLFAIGSARKGSLYETTAVPELRAQAKEIAHSLLAQFADSSRALKGSG